MRVRTWLDARRRPSTLMQRLLLLAFISASLTALPVLSVTHRHFRTIETLTRNTADAIAAQAAVIAAEPLANGDRRELERVARAMARLDHVTRVSFTRPDGEVLADLQARSGQIEPLPLHMDRAIQDGDGRTVGMLRLELDQHDARAMQREGLYLALAWLSVAWILAALVSWRVARWISRPLRELACAVTALGRGEKGIAVAVTDHAEIGDLQLGFNQASAALSTQTQKLRTRIEGATKALSHKNAELEAAGRAKARFLAAATHDLRQPLYALTLFSSALAVDETDPAKLERVNRIKECVGWLDRLFSELLDLSRLETGSLRPEPTKFALDDVFQQLSCNFRMIAEKHRLRLVVRKTNAWVRSDRTMLARILDNLVSNALRYTSHGGVLVAARIRDVHVRIDVWDTGIGIAPENQPRVFDEFFRIDPNPSKHDRRHFGLGLATVQKLAQLLDAPITLRSCPNRGSLFTFDVPLARFARDVASQPRTSPAKFDVRGMRVLVVDDDEAILSAIRFLLASWGCNVHTAEDHEAALRAVTAWPNPPDIVLIDLRLRDGANGLDVLKALDRHYGSRDDHPAFARLLITGETRSERLREIVAARIPVLYKPVTPDQLREAIVAACASLTRAHAEQPGFRESGTGWARDTTSPDTTGC